MAYKRLAEWGITIAANPQLTYRAAGRAFRMHQVMNQVRIMKEQDEDGWTRAVRWYALPMRDWWDCGITVTGGTAANYEVARFPRADRDNYDIKINLNRTSAHQVWFKYSFMDAVVDDLSNYLGTPSNTEVDGDGSARLRADMRLISLAPGDYVFEATARAGDQPLKQLLAIRIVR